MACARCAPAVRLHSAPAQQCTDPMSGNAHHGSPFAPPQQVFLEDLTLVIDVSLMLAFTTAIYLLRQKLITVATLAHALSVSLMVFTVGHYFERHLIGDMDGVENLVRRRRSGRQGAGGRWFAGWSSAALVSAAAVLLLGAYMTVIEALVALSSLLSPVLVR